MLITVDHLYSRHSPISTQILRETCSKSKNTKPSRLIGIKVLLFIGNIVKKNIHIFLKLLIHSSSDITSHRRTRRGKDNWTKLAYAVCPGRNYGESGKVKNRSTWGPRVDKMSEYKRKYVRQLIRENFELFWRVH